MKKAELVRALNRYADQSRGRMKGQNTLARFLAHYFYNLEIPADQKKDFWDIDQFIPQLLIGAVEELRSSDEETVLQLRTRYEKELGRLLPDLTDIWGNGIDQTLTVQGLGYLFQDAMRADWIADKIDTVFNAQRHLLQQEFYKFLDRVFRRGLFQMVDESPQTGMSGTFGETTLRTYMIAGRLMLTFACPGVLLEQSVSFVCTDDDPLGLGGGVQSVYTDLQTAIAMINDVITGWPSDRTAQSKAFKADDNVSIG